MKPASSLLCALTLSLPVLLGFTSCAAGRGPLTKHSPNTNVAPTLEDFSKLGTKPTVADVLERYRDTYGAVVMIAKAKDGDLFLPQIADMTLLVGLNHDSTPSGIPVGPGILVGAVVDTMPQAASGSPLYYVPDYLHAPANAQTLGEESDNWGANGVVFLIAAEVGTPLHIPTSRERKTRISDLSGVKYQRPKPGIRVSRGGLVAISAYAILLFSPKKGEK